MIKTGKTVIPNDGVAFLIIVAIYVRQHLPAGLLRSKLIIISQEPQVPGI